MMRTVLAGLLAAALLGGCAGHVSFNPMSNPYNHAIAWARANSACDAGGRASAEPASGCMVPRPGMEK